MRITLRIDDDVLEAARAVAARKGCTVGKALSDMARQALQEGQPSVRFRNGIQLLPDRPGPQVTMEDVNALRDELL